MDHKLKTLHRIYNFFKIIEIALFTVICLLPIGTIIGLIIANATNNLPLLKIFSLLGVGSFIFIILVISITGGNLIVPASAFMAECEYRDIISKSKVAAIEEKYLKTKQAQELVDRATPMKVVCNHEQGEYEYNGSKHPYNANTFRCPKCESRLLRQDLDDKNAPPLEERIFPFCKKCGQALDWEKEGK